MPMLGKRLEKDTIDLYGDWSTHLSDGSPDDPEGSQCNLFLGEPAAEVMDERRQAVQYRHCRPELSANVGELGVVGESHASAALSGQHGDAGIADVGRSIRCALLHPMCATTVVDSRGWALAHCSRTTDATWRG